MNSQICLALIIFVLASLMVASAKSGGAQEEIENLQSQMREAAEKLGPGDKVRAEVHWIDNINKRTTPTLIENTSRADFWCK